MNMESKRTVSDSTGSRRDLLLPKIINLSPVMLKVGLLISVVAVSAFIALTIADDGYTEEHPYDNVTVIVKSTKRIHAAGVAIPVKVMVRNDSSHAISFTTRDRPLKDNPSGSSSGLSEPRPVYDLVIRKGSWHKPEGYWLWSDLQKEQPPNTVTIGPGDTKVLIDTTWQPEKSYLFADVFVRFADTEFVTRLGIDQPKR